MSSLSKTPSRYPDCPQKELTDLANIISHDIRAPIRHITEFSRILAESIEQPDANQILYAEFVQNASIKLEHMIEALFSLSRLYTTQQAPQHIDMSILVNELVEGLPPRQDQHRKHVTIGKLPTIYADLPQIKLLFSHILKNAWEHSTDASNELTIDANSDDKNTIFSIADKGIGIDEKYHQAIFTLFYQIAPEDNGEHVGAGLSIAKKIVELHQGKIWLESTPGEGSTFFIALPG